MTSNIVAESRIVIQVFDIMEPAALTPSLLTHTTIEVLRLLTIDRSWNYVRWDLDDVTKIWNVIVSENSFLSFHERHKPQKPLHR
jgi:hypothetical protein